MNISIFSSEKGSDGLNKLLENSEKLWFPIRVRGRFEYKVAERFEERGVEYYLPLMKERRRWSDRWKVINKILFPGYIFVYIKRNEKFEILETPYCQSFIQFNGKMSSIPQQQIDGIRLMLERPDTLKIHERLHLVGQKVRIINGPFTGLIGQIKRMRNNTLIYLIIEQFNKMLSVEIDENDVIKHEE